MKDIKFKDKIAQGINDLFYIWKREFQTTFRDQGVLFSLSSSHWAIRYCTALSMTMKWYEKFRPL